MGPDIARDFRILVNERQRQVDEAKTRPPIIPAKSNYDLEKEKEAIDRSIWLGSNVPRLQQQLGEFLAGTRALEHLQHMQEVWNEGSSGPATLTEVDSSPRLEESFGNSKDLSVDLLVLDYAYPIRLREFAYSGTYVGFSESHSTSSGGDGDLWIPAYYYATDIYTSTEKYTTGLGHEILKVGANFKIVHENYGDKGSPANMSYPNCFANSDFGITESSVTHLGWDSKGGLVDVSRGLGEFLADDYVFRANMQMLPAPIARRWKEIIDSAPIHKQIQGERVICREPRSQGIFGRTERRPKGEHFTNQSNFEEPVSVRHLTAYSWENKPDFAAIESVYAEKIGYDRDRRTWVELKTPPVAPYKEARLAQEFFNFVDYGKKS